MLPKAVHHILLAHPMSFLRTAILTCGTLLLAAVPAQRMSAQQRTDAECARVRERALAIRDVIDSSIGTPPRLRRWVGSPENAPPGDRDKTARFDVRVDEQGVPIPESIRFSGLFDVAFTQKLKKQYEQHRFVPATIDGCNVEGSFTVRFRIRNNGAIEAPPPAPVPQRAAVDSSPFLMGPQCAAARERARTGKLLPTDTLYPPLATRIFLPPMPRPPKLRGMSVVYSTLVDSAGRSVETSAVITEIPDRGYQRRMIEAFSKTTYRPAILDGCVVQGRYQVTVNL